MTRKCGLPEWYIRAKSNEPYYNSDTFYMLLDEAIQEYNKAIRENNLDVKTKWQEFILDKLTNKSANGCIVKQFEGGHV